MTKIILVRPQLSSNIGAIARVMMNFGCSELRLVSPRPNWCDDDAKALSAGAVSLLENAQVYDDLPSAIADLTSLYALTARTRYINKPVLNVKDIESIEAQNIGLMFGPENSGLSNEDIVLANKIIYIPTSPKLPSLNIAQAVAICLHELYESSTLIQSNSKASPVATLAEIDSFLKYLELHLDNTDFLRVKEKRADMLRNIKNIFTRVENLSEQEVSTLKGIISALASK